MRQLSDHVNTFGQVMKQRYGQRVHKLALTAGFTCPNRDGSQGNGGCTFCNNASFAPYARQPEAIDQQMDHGRQIVEKRTRARKYIAYFQAYTNTYAEVATLKALYDDALSKSDVIGLSVGTRPDCVPEAVLDLLCDYRDRGHEIWLELGLQSAFDKTLERVNRGHGWAAYENATRRARRRGLQVCTHLIAGLPGERCRDTLVSLQRVLEVGVEGLKLHPLHVVKGTVLANQWRRGEYQPLDADAYIELAADVVEASPPELIFHRLHGTVQGELLLAPDWCGEKWRILNGIEQLLHQRHLARTQAPTERPAQPTQLL